MSVSTSRSQTGQGSSPGEIIGRKLFLKFSRSFFAVFRETENVRDKFLVISLSLHSFNKRCAILVAVGFNWYIWLAFTSSTPLPSASILRWIRFLLPFSEKGKWKMSGAFEFLFFFFEFIRDYLKLICRRLRRRKHIPHTRMRTHIRRKIHRRFSRCLMSETCSMKFSGQGSFYW